MITPRFSITQDEIFIYISIRAPYCSLNELEIYVDSHDFRFICHPYYLRLNLPGNILENDSSSGNFNSDKGEFLFKYQKESRGEEFEGLNFITSLLAPSKKKTQRPEIEVLATEDDDFVTGSKNDDEWFVEQNIPTEENICLINCGYGFANQKFNVLTNTETEYYSVFDIKGADNTNLEVRNKLRLETESSHFNLDHVLGDLLEPDEIDNIIKQTCLWQQNANSFTPKEIDIIKDFPNREYLLSKDEVSSVLLGLLDILYAFCYDRRTTDFEGTCESGWTITKLSATLSWFVKFENANETIISSYRRCMTYPLYRNFKLCQSVLQDLKQLVSSGEVIIVKSLIEIYNILNSSSESRYILNDLYIKDYIIYMQKCDRESLKDVIESLNEVIIKEEDLEFNLEVIRKTIEFDKETVFDKLAKMTIAESDSDDTDSSSDSSSTTSSDSDDSSDDSN